MRRLRGTATGAAAQHRIHNAEAGYVAERRVANSSSGALRGFAALERIQIIGGSVSVRVVLLYRTVTR